MEESATLIPGDVNVKLIFRHSIRPSLKGRDDSDEVSLTPEGVCLARFFGKGMEAKIGYVNSSRPRRCRETVESMLKARHQDETTMVISDALSSVFVKDPILFRKMMEEKKSLKELIVKLNKGEAIPGMYGLEDSVRRLLDFVFSVGNDVGKLDLFCTHDFQLMIITSLLYTRYSSIDEIKDNWPRMLEGIFIWGERDDFYSSWRGEIKHFIGFGM